MSRKKRSAGPRPELPALVKPWAAALASLVVPGLGQALSRAVWRGVLVLASLGAIAAMFAWRVQVVGYLVHGFAAQLAKTLERQPGFTVIVLASAALVWLLNAWDAWLRASRKSGNPALFPLILLAFFGLGWQISEVQPGRLITDFPQAMQPLSRVVWPWEAAVVREPILEVATASIRVPTDPAGGPPPEPVVEGEPHLVADPSTGELSRMDDTNTIIPGTTIAVTGTGFRPGITVELWWRDPLRNAFQLRAAGNYVTVVPDADGAFSVQAVMPYSLGPVDESGGGLHLVEARQTVARAAARASEPLRLVVQRMVETIVMGMMATLFGIILAVPVAFLAARNIMAASPVTLAIYYLTRTILNIIRSIEPLIWALIAVVWVGLGPFAGIVALTIHSVASLGKLYSEAIEAIDPGPIEAIEATGASRLQTIAYAVVPQMISPFVSFSIYRWDVNVRMSTVIGLVGGGGVGFILVQYIRLLDYRAAGIAVWFIAVTVAVLDYVSAEIRRRFQ